MEREDLLEQVLDHVPSGLLTLSPEHVVLYRNQAAIDLVPQIEVGMDIWDALEPAANVEKVDRLVRGERVIFAPAPDATVLEWTLTEKMPPDGNLILMTWDATFTDELIQERITFIVSASHELKSPLTALLGFAEILEMDIASLDEHQAEAVTMVRQNAQHLRMMVDDIVDLSKNSFGELGLELETVDVLPVVEDVCETLRPQIEAKGQTLTVESAVDLPAIEVDSQRIRQIIFNLLQNAHVHTSACSSIEVTTAIEGDVIAIRVADDGDGLKFDNPDDAFRSFRRGEPSDGSIPGSGIGLTISRQLALLHRGSIEVESEPGIGTTFTVRLPLDREKARAAISPER